MYKIGSMPHSIQIGFTGETNFRSIEIDMTAWMEKMPAGVPSIIHIRPGEPKENAYIAATTFDTETNVLTWVITAGDIGTMEGDGEMQIWLEETESDTVTKRGKSVKVTTKVEESANDPGSTPPEYQEAVLEQMTALKTQTVNASEAAETAQGKAEDAQGAAETAQTAAETAQTAAETAQGKAEDAQEAAEGSAEDAEAYAVGTRNGVDVESDDPAYENNAKYYAEEAATALEDKLDAPATAGTAGQVLTSDGEGGQAWADPSGAIDDTAGEGDTDVTWSADKLAETTGQLLTAIHGINEKITTDVFKDIVYDDAYRSNMLNLSGCLEPSIDRDVLKYKVNAGETLHLKIEKEYVWAATYQFQNNSEVPSSDNPYIVGETVTTEVDDDVVVPSGATWLIVSQLKTNETNKIQRGEKADLIGIIEDKLERVENEIYVQDHKDGNVVIFDDHVTDSVISAISRFQYDENGITSAILSKSGKNIASVGFRTDLPSIITGTYPGSVSGYGTTMIPIHGKQVTASMQYDVPVSDTNVRSIYLFYYDKDKTYINYVSTSINGNNRGFVTTPVGAEYIVLRADGQTGLTVEGQIEYGTSMTEYEEYKGANYTETFGVTIYGGYLNWNTGLLVSTLASDGSKLNPPVEYNLSENEIVSNGSVTILFANIGIVEASCAMPTAKKIEEIDGEVHPFGTLPGYWEDGSGYLSNKVDTITNIARSCASNADVFYFLTDLHWTLNKKHSPAIIEFLNKRINVPRLFNGGDNADYFKDTAEVSRILRKVMGQGEYYMADGNHEYLQNKTFSDNFYANRMFADKAIYGDSERTYYYVDNPASKMRYVVLATYAPWEGGQSVDRLNNVDQQTWFSNTALNVQDGWTVIVFVHIFSTYNKTLIAGTTAYIQAMQSMQHGEVACIIQGDQHHDYTMYVANDTIPIVCSTCDKNTNVSAQTHDVEDYENRPTGTINEQAFDVVIVDKTNKNIHFVRIGYAKNGEEVRTVHYGGN